MPSAAAGFAFALVLGGLFALCFYFGTRRQAIDRLRTYGVDEDSAVWLVCRHGHDVMPYKKLRRAYTAHAANWPAFCQQRDDILAPFYNAPEPPNNGLFNINWYF